MRKGYNLWKQCGRKGLTGELESEHQAFMRSPHGERCSTLWVLPCPYHRCYIASVILELAPYWKRVINIMCVYALLALSFDFLANYVGLVCLGGAFFVGVGGSCLLYSAFIFFPVLFPYLWLRSVELYLCSLVPCLPLRGVYFAIVTLMYPHFLQQGSLKLLIY